MNDMKATIIPKSDQLNADDLLSGPITIKITDVKIKAGQEQPVAIHYDGDNGKPYKACKSMCRVMVSAWGADASKYIGRSLTLYCDPKVKWGGMEVGGIRISHMSDIDSSMTMALTVTRANKKPFTVKPLNIPSPPASAVTGEGKGTAAPDATESLGASATSSVAPSAAASDYITAEQIREIESLLEMKGINKPRFLMKAKVDSVERITADRFDGAIKWIDSQKGAA